MPRISITKTSSRASSDQLTDAIKKKAYELFEKRGRKTGHSMDDWLEAERIVKSK